MKSLNKILTSTVIISLVPFIIICFTIPFDLNKNLLKLEGKTTLAENQYVWYIDLDNDRVSEQIMASAQDITTAIIITRNGAVLDQWNFNGTFDFWNKQCLFIAGDTDNDNTKEIYVFTLNNDTILLHCIPSPNSPEISIKNRVIALTGKGQKKADPFIIPGEPDDLDNDGIKELIFGIGSGFSIYPRKVFAYYILQDSLVGSPESSFFITAIQQADINNDGKKEILPQCFASANVDPKIALYHDHSTFLTVLDQNLDFLFRPIEITGRFTALSSIIFENPDTKKHSVAWVHTGEKFNSTLYFIDDHGSISDSVLLNYKIYGHIFPGVNENALLQIYLDGGIGLINKDFMLVKSFPEIRPGLTYYMDVDSDGKQEIVLLEVENNKIHIFREGYSDEVSLFAELSKMPHLVSLKNTIGSKPLISVQSGLNHYLISYGKNPAYPYLYLYYPAIYLSILAFTTAVKSIQKNQTRKKYETEKRISELQLALIRNQLDPHFTFNVINSIICSVEFRENEQAAEQLRQFAGMYRNMLITAGETRRRIDEELDFCEKYLRLEKMRFREKFDYSISISESVDRNFLVPKFIIQIYAENAIKHGLSSLEKGGILKICLDNSEGCLHIDISDNGIGRAASAELDKKSTGKGLETMEELFSVYNRYYDEKISSHITDLYDQAGNPSGTRITITISNHDEKG